MYKTCLRKSPEDFLSVKKIRVRAVPGSWNFHASYVLNFCLSSASSHQIDLISHLDLGWAVRADIYNRLVTNITLGKLLASYLVLIK
jgi:hypothetical protein